MEPLKPLHEIATPDRLSASYVLVNQETGETRPFTITDFHQRLSTIRLGQTVPDDIRSYFETIKNIFLYGWFVYSFYTVAMFLSFIVIEMALREKFRKDDPERKWPFQKLIKEAKSKGFIADEGFVSVKLRRDQLVETFGRADIPWGQPAEDYCEILVKSIPYLRNYFAHPGMNAIALPADASSAMVLAAEFINQLFPEA